MHPSRLDALLDAPTLAEVRGSDWTTVTWLGLVGLPGAVAGTLVEAAGKVLLSGTFAAVMRDFRGTLKPIIDELGIAL